MIKHTAPKTLYQGISAVLILTFFFFLSASPLYGGDTREESIPVFTYHTHPPFITAGNRGLSYDLAEYLSRKSGGRYTFLVKPMSRPRVNKMLKESRRGLVPWVNPAWFNDEPQKRYTWSDSSLMEDSNAVISHQDLPVTYEGPQSFDNLTFGGVRAHVYMDVDGYRKRTGLIKRVDAENHIDNFRKLAKRRVDVTITPKSGAEYLIKKEGLQDILFISPRPHSTFTRQVIVADDSPDLLEYINEIIAGMPLDGDWRDIMRNYR